MANGLPGRRADWPCADDGESLKVGWAGVSNVLRGKRNRLQQELADGPLPTVPESGPTERDHSPGSRALHRRWAEMIKRVYEVDPLLCPQWTARWGLWPS